MKIGFVFDDSLDKPDGIQQYLLSLGAWLIGNGHEVHYLVGQTERQDIAHVHSLSRNVKVRFNGNRLSMPLPAGRRPIRRLLAAEQFDVLHVQMPYSPFLAGRIIQAAPSTTAIVGTFHVAPYSKAVSLATHGLALLCRRSLRRFDSAVSVSPAAAEFALQTFGLQTAVLPNVFDYDRFHNAQPLPQYDDQLKTIVFLGRLVTRKGCMTLLKAIKMLKDDGRTHTTFRVVICGGGPLEQSLRDYAGRYGLDAMVTFAGRVSEADKPRYLASADIAVFPSSAGESFGIVLIEAMASGRAAVIGGDNPGYRSVLGDQPSQLFPASDARALADSLAAWLDNEPSRQTAARWGAEAARQYDVAVVGTQLVKLYQSVAQNSSNE